MDILRAPPAEGKYILLKNSLIETFAPDQYQRASRLLHMAGLGDNKPSVLMDNMLSLLGNHEPCFLFRQIFLEQLPEDIRAHLIRSGLSDCRELAKAADELWQSRSVSTTHAISRPPNHSRSVQRAMPSDPFCFYHRKFGSKARQCRPPCSFAQDSAGNAMAGRP